MAHALLTALLALLALSATPAAAQQPTASHDDHQAAEHGRHQHGAPPDAERRAHLEEKNRIYDQAWAEWRRELHGITVKPGMAVADIGAGGGELAVLLAERVGRDGRVWATEIERAKVEEIQRLAADIDHLIPVLASADDPSLPPATVELAVMVEVFHHVERPGPFLKALAGQLEPGARLAIVEPDAAKSEHGPAGCYADLEETKKLARDGGFEVESVHRHTVLDLEFFVLIARLPLAEQVRP